MAVVFVWALWATALAVPAAAQSDLFTESARLPEPAATAEGIAVRDQLIADQEALLNVYRCMFDIDTEVVPGGCAGGPDPGGEDFGDSVEGENPNRDPGSDEMPECDPAVSDNCDTVTIDDGETQAGIGRLG